MSTPQPTEINFVDSGGALGGNINWTAGAPYPDPNNPEATRRDLVGTAVGAGINWRGPWNSGASYLVNDAVALNGASYICISPNTNQTPPNGTYWNVIATYEPPSRSSYAKTTATLATNASESGSFAVAKSFYLLTITFSCKARVTLYSTAAAQSADASRAWGTVPLEYTEHEVICDVQVATGSFPFTWIMSPAAVGFNADGTPSTSIYYKITNLDTSQAVTITLAALPLET